MSISILVILSLILLSTSFSVVSGQNLTAYEVVEKYKLPRGLLPKGVVDYSHNAKTGYFKVFFNGTCQFPVDIYKLKYDSTISGFIRNGRVTRLVGVSVKMLFFWLNIAQVSRDGDSLDFSVGVASEDFSLHRFTESPQCGCGFYCYGGLVFSS